MSKTIRVTAPYVALKIEDPNLGTYLQGYYEGAIVENVNDASAAHHIESGLAVSASTDDMPAAPPMEDGVLEELSGGEPGGNASREEWASYARTKGAADADLVDVDGKPLTRDMLRDQYGTPSE